MDYTKKDLEIANIIYDKMKTLPIGNETSVSELGRLALEGHPSYNGVIPMYDDWWPIMVALRSLLQREKKLRMDFTKHQLLCEGLPFNIHFVLLKWGQKVYANEAKAARRFAKEHNLYGVRFVCYFYDLWVFDIKHEPGILVDLAYPPAYIVVEEKGNTRFSTPDESIKICMTFKQTK